MSKPNHLKKIPFDICILPRTTKAFLVGGSVRDLILELPAADYDIAIQGNPEKYAHQTAQNTSGRLVLMGKPGQEIYRVVTQAFTLDITRIKGSSLQADLAQRDFTINAMAISLDSGKRIDPLGGQHDLNKKKISMISESAFKNDPIRLLRAFRLAAVLNFKIGPRTLAAIGNHAPMIKNVAAERVRTEIMSLFSTQKAHPMLCQMAEAGLLFHLFPELKPLVGCMQNRFHVFDVYQHTLSAFSHLENIQTDPVDPIHQILTQNPETADNLDWAIIKSAILFHDLGKPATRTVETQGTVHFYGHAEKGAQMAGRLTRRLRFSTRTANKISFIIRNHVHPLNLFIAVGKFQGSSKAKARFFIKFGDRTPEILLHAIADIRGKGDSKARRNRRFISFSEDLLSEFFTRFVQIKKAPLLINGHDLIQELGITPSPIFKSILEEIEAASLSGVINDRQSALEMAKALLIRLRA